jgi:hypothetical protein
LDAAHGHPPPEYATICRFLAILFPTVLLSPDACTTLPLPTVMQEISIAADKTADKIFFPFISSLHSFFCFFKFSINSRCLYDIILFDFFYFVKKSSAVRLLFFPLSPLSASVFLVLFYNSYVFFPIFSFPYLEKEPKIGTLHFLPL